MLFEEPFWVGIYERYEGGKYEVCKIVFGAEPKDYDVWSYVLANHEKLRFSPPVKAENTEEKEINPKRMQRLIGKEIGASGIGTKAQQAIKLLQEQGKIERKALSKQQREDEKARRLELHRQKQKEKHRGH